MPPRIQLSDKENALASSRTFFDDRDSITFKTYGSVPNTWIDNLLLYAKFSNDNVVETPNRLNSSYQEFFKATYYSEEFFNRCQVFGQSVLASGSGFFQTSLENYDPRVIKTLEQAQALAFTNDNLGLNFNSFGVLDRTPKFYFTPNSTENFNYHAIFTTEDQIDLQGTDLSFSLWFKCDTAYDDGEAFLLKRGDEFEINFEAVEPGKAGTFTFTMGPAGNRLFVQRSLPRLSPKFNDWIHVVATYISGANVVDLFINGTNNYPVNSGSIGTFAPYNSTELIYLAIDPEQPTRRWNGLLNEVAFFDKALSATEVEQIYNCRSSLVLPEQGGVVYPIGLNTQNKWITSTEFTSSMIIPGARTVVNVADNFVDFSQSETIQNFCDSNLFASDGKSNQDDFYSTGSSVVNAGEGFQQPLWDKTVLEFDYEVLLTGSVGYRSASNSVSEGADHAMMYWNPGTKTFNPIGSGNGWNYYQDIYDTNVGVSGAQEASELTMQSYLAEKAVGFLPFVPNVANSQFATYYSQAPISEFGFPFDDKYHVPHTGNSSSILIPLNDKIHGPFVAEKIVVEFSCSHFSRDYWAQGTGGAHGEAINTFFVLNQRKTKNYFSGAIAPKIDLSTGTVVQTTYTIPFAATTSSIDLVSFNQFAFLAAETGSIDTDSAWISVKNALNSRDIQYILCGQDNGWERIRFDYTGSLVISGAINLPYPTQNVQRTNPTILPTDSIKMTVPGPAGTAGGSYNELQYPGSYGGRSGVAQYGISDSRNLIRNVVGIERYNTTDTIAGTQKVYPKLQQPTPYILQPTDNLIFGFQCAYMGKSEYSDAFPFTSSSVNRGPTLSILPGTFKVRIYGSYVVEGVEYHDTLNQILTSNTIRKVFE